MLQGLIQVSPCHSQSIFHTDRSIYKWLVKKKYEKYSIWSFYPLICCLHPRRKLSLNLPTTSKYSYLQVNLFTYFIGKNIEIFYFMVISQSVFSLLGSHRFRMMFKRPGILLKAIYTGLMLTYKIQDIFLLSAFIEFFAYIIAKNVNLPSSLPHCNPKVECLIM